MRSIVLLSGGVDSTVALHQRIRDGHAVSALTVKKADATTNTAETDCATALCMRLGVDQVVLDLSFLNVLFPAIRGGTLSVGGSAGDCIKPQGDDDDGERAVPLSLEMLHVCGLMHAASSGAAELVWALNRDEYPSTERAMWEKYAARWSAWIQERYDVPTRLVMPFIDMDKASVIELGTQLGADLESTVSCSSPRGSQPCGRCSQCGRRELAFGRVKDAVSV